MQSASRILVVTGAALFVVGCAANPFTQFYRGNADPRTLEDYLPPSRPLEIFSSGDLARDVDALEARGFQPIGSSDFNAPSNRVSDRQLREQAEKLGVAAVLVSSRYSNTVSGAMPLVLPNTSTSVTNGSATMTGSGGFATVNGSATTTTYGTQTMMMPYSIRRSDFAAVYFVRWRYHLGIQYGVIDPATRQRLQTNAGALAKLVVDDSAAARADILPGDIILTIDGERVEGPQGLNAQLKDRRGREVVLGIDRNGSRVEKRVTPAP